MNYPKYELSSTVKHERWNNWNELLSGSGSRWECGGSGSRWHILREWQIRITLTHFESVADPDHVDAFWECGGSGSCWGILRVWRIRSRWHILRVWRIRIMLAHFFEGNCDSYVVFYGTGYLKKRKKNLLRLRKDGKNKMAIFNV